MPELPEVETVLQTLTTGHPSLVGRKVRDVVVLRESVIDADSVSPAQSLIGSCCSKIFRHGKYLFFGFTHSRDKQCSWMALHLRMTGRLFLVPEQEARERYTRFILMLDSGMALRFDDPRAFGRVWMVDSPETVTVGLGPDALSLSIEIFLQRLGGLKRQLKPLLLDQSFVAGVGNIYADETLFRAGLHPLRTTQSLQPDESVRLYEALSAVLEQAVTAKGANIDGVFKAGSFPVQVYGRGGMPCTVCGTEIMKMRLGQRGTHFCPACQSSA